MESSDKKKKALKDLIAGGIAGGIANLAVAPIDAIKDTMRNNRTNNRNALTEIAAGKKTIESFHEAPIKPIAVAKDIWRGGKGLKNKVQGFYSGAGTSIAKIVPASALSYMLYELTQAQLNKEKQNAH